MTLSKQQINQLCDDIENVAALNARGLVVRVYRAADDLHEWVYGSLCFGENDPIFVKSGLDRAAKQIQWDEFRAMLTRDAAI